MKVLIADKFSDGGVEELRDAGCDVSFDPGLTDDALRDAIKATACQVLVVRGTKVTGEMLEVSPQLAVVIRAGAGYNSIDVATASKRSIRVANCPGKNAVAVAELTFALILALDRRIVDGTNDLRAGVWKKGEYGKARGLKDRILGLVGMGKIGQAVASRARAFEMNVLAWSRSLTDERADQFGVQRRASIEALADEVDILSIHLAAAPETKGLLGAAVFDRLQPGSYVINTARAEVVDYAALQAAVAARGLRVGLDVYPNEPGGGVAEFRPEIFGADSPARSGVVYGSHHIGASTQQAQDAIARETVRIVKEYKHRGHVANCVNLQSDSPAQYVLVVRHLNQPGVLAHTLGAISYAGVNVEEMENVICEGAAAACAQIKLDGSLGEDVLRRIKDENEHVLGVTLSKLR